MISIQRGLLLALAVVATARGASARARPEAMRLPVNGPGRRRIAAPARYTGPYGSA